MGRSSLALWDRRSKVGDRRGKSKDRRSRLAGMSGPPMRRWPAWVLPLLVVIGLICALTAVLYYYFGPRPSDLMGLNPNFTSTERVLATQIGPVELAIPASYTRIPAERVDGPTQELSLHAVLPDLAPYASSRQEQFEDLSDQSPIVHLQLRHSDITMPTEQRLQDLYGLRSMKPVETGILGGLDHYRLEAAPDHRDLYVGRLADGERLVLRCSEDRAGGVPASCMRTVILEPGFVLTYRYRRAHLADWRAIDGKAVQLIKGFEAAAEAHTATSYSPPAKMATDG